MSADIETNGEKRMLDVINDKLNGWSLLGSTASIDRNSIFDKIVTLDSLFVTTLFNVYVTANPKEPKFNLLRVRRSFLEKKTKQHSV
jgi:hypothetical protein